MEIEEVIFKVVADDRGHDEVLGRTATLLLAFALFNAAAANYPKREITLRHGARVIRRRLPQAAPK